MRNVKNCTLKIEGDTTKSTTKDYAMKAKKSESFS